MSKLYLKHYWFHFFPDTVYAEQGQCNGRASICLSACLSRRPTAATVAGGFAAECHAGMIYQSIAAGALCASCYRRRRSAKTGSVTLRATCFIYIFIRINCSFKNKKFKKKQRKKIPVHTTCQRTQRVKCLLTMHSGSAR